jgi:hypothetical protein
MIRGIDSLSEIRGRTVNYRRPAFGNSVTESTARSRQYEERRYARHEKSTYLSPMPACNDIIAATRWQATSHLSVPRL